MNRQVWRTGPPRSTICSSWAPLLNLFSVWPTPVLEKEGNIGSSSQRCLETWVLKRSGLPCPASLAGWTSSFCQAQWSLPCPLPTPGVYSNSHPLSWWWHPTISSSVIPFSSCLQSFPASGSFPVSQFFASSGQSIGVSASTSVLPMNMQDWFLLGWTGWISLKSPI